MYCEGCGEPLAYETKFCTKCGKETSSAPRAIAGKQGLDPRRFVGGEAPAVATSNRGAGGNGSSAPAKKAGSGTINSAIVGTYEYVKPGSFEKSTQTLTLNANGSCSYSENGQTSMEIYTSSGTGSWEVSDGVLRVIVDALTKDTKFKSNSIVPGIKEGKTIEYNLLVPITESEITNATPNGTNKWRIKRN